MWGTDVMDTLEQTPTKKSRKRKGPHPVSALTAVFIRNVKKPGLYAEQEAVEALINRG
jgi:hypothetical protein